MMLRSYIRLSQVRFSSFRVRAILTQITSGGPRFQGRLYTRDDSSSERQANHSAL